MVSGPTVTALHNEMALGRVSGFVSAAPLHCWGFFGGRAAFKLTFAINISLIMNQSVGTYKHVC